MVKGYWVGPYNDKIVFLREIFSIEAWLQLLIRVVFLFIITNLLLDMLIVLVISVFSAIHIY